MLPTIAFVIFGLKRRDKSHGGAVMARCDHCRNDVLLHPYGWRTWFHIFWIPLIPWTATRTLMCPICGSHATVDEQTYESAIDLADKATAASDGRISNREYWAAVDAADLDIPGYDTDPEQGRELDDPENSDIGAVDSENERSPGVY